MTWKQQIYLREFTTTLLVVVGVLAIGIAVSNHVIKKLAPSNHTNIITYDNREKH